MTKKAKQVHKGIDSLESLPVGTLPDFEIEELVSKGQLICRNFQKSNLKQACYELRASRRYHEPLIDDLPRTVESDGYILIKPKQLCVILTEEVLYIPNDILARILSKGQLFSLGLIPVNTYADPGFRGCLGIVLTNVSNNYLKIVPGETIAKIDFTRLTAPVTTEYHGQHGYETGIWPNRKDLILTDLEQKSDPRIGDPISELEAAYGVPLIRAVKRIERLQFPIIVSTFVYFVFVVLLAVAFGERLINSSLWNITLGVASTLLYIPMTWLSSWILESMERKRRK